MRRKQSVTHLDQRYNIMLDNAFYIVSCHVYIVELTTVQSA